MFTKIKRNEVVHDQLLPKISQKNSLAYDLESLKKIQLLSSQKGPSVSASSNKNQNQINEDFIHNAYIPSKDQIDQAKKLREKKRLRLDHGDEDQGPPGFISIEENAVSTFRIESRLVTEDQDEGVETFDDYSGNALAFGAKAVQEAQDSARREKLELM